MTKNSKVKGNEQKQLQQELQAVVTSSSQEEEEEDTNTTPTVINTTATTTTTTTTSTTTTIIMKTPKTTDLQQIQILCQRNFRKDKQKPTLWFARTLAVAPFVMLYTIGFFIGYPSSTSSSTDSGNINNEQQNLQNGDYILHEPTNWTFPKRIIMNYNHNNIMDYLDNNNDLNEGTTKIIPEDTTLFPWNNDDYDGGSADDNNNNTTTELFNYNYTEFQDYCQSNIENIYTDVCVFIDDTNNTNNMTTTMNNDTVTVSAAANPTNISYRILYGGTYNDLTPYEPMFAGTQYIMTSLFVDSTTNNNNKTNTTSSSPTTTYYASTQLQQTPQQYQEATSEEIIQQILPIGLTIGILTSLAIVVTSGFKMAPILTERKLEVTQAFCRVGVRLRTYMFQWIVYMSINTLIASIVLTAVAIFWKLFPMSSPGLIFGSFYLVLFQMDLMIVLFSQLAPDEESASGYSFLFFAFSVGIACAFIFTMDNFGPLMSIFGIFSPHIGVIHFAIRYVEYDIYGYGTGISVASEGNFVESGLIGSYIGSLLGIVMYFIAILIYSTPRWSKMVHDLFFNTFCISGKRSANNDDNNNNNNNGNQEHDEDEGPIVIEPLTSQDDVLLSTDNLQHTYFPTCCSGSKQPTEVLKGVDMNLTRNSVLGLLGHNGCGKSTTIKILSGELELQDGSVRFNFQEGTVEMNGDGQQQPQRDQEGNGNILNIDIDSMKRRIGVCPQHNNLLGDESCRETLRLFASLRGNLPLQYADQSVEDATDAEVTRIIEEIDFTSSEDADKPVKTYSGGMKRKVSIGIALIGDPEIVFLDEPSAGLDPYNRRTIWNLIIAAKKNRSIVLCSHHLEEVDLLSDRVAIMNDGQIVAYGSPLFLKHHYGGYSLRYEASDALDVSKFVPGAVSLPMEKPQHFQWKIKHGSEPYFAQLLSKLDEHGATNVALELTTLEQVFLETSKEEQDLDDTANSDHTSSKEGEELGSEGIEVSLHQPANDNDKSSWLGKIWEKRGDVSPIGFWKKFLLVQGFMNKNAWKQKGALIVNVMFPLIYMVAGLVLVYVIGEPEAPTLVEQGAIPIKPSVLLENVQNGVFFGVPNSTAEYIDPIVPVEAPDSVDFFFDDDQVVLGGHWEQNATLQYNPDLTPFALQLSEFATSMASLTQNDSSIASLDVYVQQLPFVSEEPFRVDFLILPIALVFGFTGMVMSVLDILELKGNNAVSLFRVAGVNEWTVYLGVMYYKCTTTFMPFFVLTLVLCLAFKNVLLGNGGRWLASILTMFLFAYSSTPIGLIIGKRFIHKDFESAKGWFPAAYFTLISIPYLAWNLAYQNLPQAQDALLIVGDFLCLIPPVAFQRSLGAIIDVSLVYNDPNLTWRDVWTFETRVFLSIILMFGVGTLEWLYLYRVTTTRPQQTKLEEENERQPEPVDDEDILAEKQWSLVDDDGINAREIVKVFRTDITEDGKKTSTLKKAVKGIDFGIKKNEIYVLLGPNGAGKTSLMSTIAAEYTPEHGSVAIDDRVLLPEDRSTDHMFDRCNVSWCPQEDALFPQLSVFQHLEFYARMRGLDWGSDSATQHIDAIVRLLGLTKHVKKLSTELSGGYKRRLSLAIAMIGYPTSMLVDECTTGVDPGARHLIWGVLQPDLISDAYSLPAILLSTHYMDEAAKLATRIGIMINGEMVASGSLGRLQERYCSSYFVEIALEEDAAGSVEEDTVAAFLSKGMEATVYESIPLNFKLQVPFLPESETSSSGRIQQLISIFDLLETKKADLRVKFYSVAQMSLEQIFIDLSRQQFDEDESLRERQTSTR